MRRWILALAVFLPSVSPLFAGECPAERARYTQVGSRVFTAAFVAAGSYGTAASNLLFVVRSRHESHWFRFQAANGYGGIYLEAITDPATANPEEGPRPRGASGDTQLDGGVRGNAFIRYRANLSEIKNPMQAGESAPPVIVLPDLGATLWYDTSVLADRLNMSRAAFRLSGCAKPTKAKVQRG